MRAGDHHRRSAAAAVSLAVLIGESVALSEAPYAHRGSCPSHPDRSRSLYVSDATGFFHCFGCGRSGDAVTWVMAQTGASEAKAIAALQLRKDAGTNPDS